MALVPMPGVHKRISVLFLGSVRAHFGLALRVLQRAQFGRYAAGNGGSLAAILKTRKIRPVAPCERTAQPLARSNRSVMHDVDQAFVVGCALLVAREIAEISAGRKDRGDARNGR